MSPSDPANRFVREILHPSTAVPPTAARFYYTSHLAIDDPLSPLPPPLSSGSAPLKLPPRPFSEFDNEALEQAWLRLRRELLHWNEEEASEKRKFRPLTGTSSVSRDRSGSTATPGRRGTRVSESVSRSGSISRQRPRGQSRAIPIVEHHSTLSSTGGEPSSLSTSLRGLESAEVGGHESPSTTGTPFIRAPSRTKISSNRPAVQPLDSYQWDTDQLAAVASGRPSTRQGARPQDGSPSAKVPVGVSRLHRVVMPQLQMEPIYWSPLNDIASVARATWFYQDTMMPVEADVANMLEAGYTAMQPWTQTWADELNSAVEVGALGEMKILHKLWPDKHKLNSRPSTSMTSNAELVGDELARTEEQEREETINAVCDLIDIASGTDKDNKASGSSTFGRDGTKRVYASSGVIYVNEREAYILRPSLQPSEYYGRRPLANFIRRNRNIGISVVRGFDQRIWDKLHPLTKGTTTAKALGGVSTAQAGESIRQRKLYDSPLARSERPRVTDLVLVIHGIGQKLSERMESFHFTHAINAFRREVNVELETDEVKANLREDMGGVMVLPVNWRLSLSFEDGGYRDEAIGAAQNAFTLKDITPESLPSVRNIISDVMLDVPYYLSPEHNPKMIAACTREANHIYRLWCANNPGFEKYGRVHLLAHSLGSVMAVDILSNQPTHMPPELGSPDTREEDLPKDHFLFDTRCAFMCGSPAGFFLLLKKATLLPRSGRCEADNENSTDPDIVGEQHTYGCLSVDNLYNIINPYDPVAYRMNAAVDANYAGALRPAFVPSAQKSWFRNPFRSSSSALNSTATGKPSVTRLPSTVELETHNFTREEIAERRAYLLNDNGQIDFFLKYGGGALEIQYLTMLGAHSSYWISNDFVRMIVQEVGRPLGRKGTIEAMRAVKKKQPV